MFDGHAMPTNPVRRSVDRYCGACGYEFPRDDTADSCLMCARYEQLRMESAALRPSAIPSRQTATEEALTIKDQLRSRERAATQSQYGVVFAAYRASRSG